MKKYSYSKEDLVEAVEKSISIRQVLIKLNIIPAGGNYFTINKLIKKYGLDISHMTKNGWSKGKKLSPKRPVEDYLSNKISIQSFKLKNRLISEKIMEYKCYNCNLIKWLNKNIPLELHHINGNSQDNNLSNLILLCPNCHSLTENYRGKGKK